MNSAILLPVSEHTLLRTHLRRSAGVSLVLFRFEQASSVPAIFRNLQISAQCEPAVFRGNATVESLLRCSLYLSDPMIAHEHASIGRPIRVCHCSLEFAQSHRAICP